MALMTKITFLLASIAATRLVISKHVSLSDNTIPLDFDDYFSLNDPIEVSYNDVEESVKKPNICETEDCKRIAQRFITAMNKSADPCVDFYEFSCGRHVESSSWEIIDDMIDQRLRETFENEANTNEDLPTRQATKWYRACMNIDKLNAIGMEPINSILLQVGGWPISMEENEWTADNYPWQMIENHYARLMGGNVFYDVKVEMRAQQSPFGSIVLTPPERYPINKRPYFNDDELYASFVTKTVKMFVKNNKAAVPNTILQQRIQDLIQFEKNILKLATDELEDDAMRWPANPMTFKRFVDWYRNRTKHENPASKTAIDWETGIKQIFRSVNIDINQSDPIYVWNEEYFLRIGHFLEQTPARTIVNYVHWNFIVTMLKHTTEEMRNEIFHIRRPRWFECLHDMKIRWITAYAYEKKYLPPTTRNITRSIFENIKNSLEANVGNSDWLDETSKSLIKSKIKNLNMFIGYPDWYTNLTAITNYYKSLTIGTQYFDNALSYMRFESKKKLLASMISGDDIDVWPDPITTAAGYSEYLGGFEMTTGFLQMPVFSPDVPDYVNYGLAGSIAGHELGHGVDDDGIQYNGYNRKSNEKISMGLSQKILEAWYKRVRCFVKQYDKYFGEENTSKDDGVNLKYDDMGDSMGSFSKGENIADFVGLESLYTAYKQLKIKKRSSELKLPGLGEFTDEQLLLISYAFSFCHKKKPGFGKMHKGHTHSPNNIRTNGPVSNLNDFSKIFNCPIATPMNPIDKCSLWKKTSSEPEAIKVIKD